MQRICITGLVLSLLYGTPAGAQVSIGAGGQLLRLSGDDFRGTGVGLGGDAHIMLPIGRSVTMGGAVLYSAHNDDFFDNAITILGVVVEGRYLFPTPSSVATPYVAARGGYAHTRTSGTDVTGDGVGDVVTSSGFMYGVGGGIVVGISQGLSLDIGMVLHQVSFKDASVNGTPVIGTDQRGGGLQIRAGVAFKVGS